jgi:hypothetical protein
MYSAMQHKESIPEHYLPSLVNTKKFSPALSPAGRAVKPVSFVLCGRGFSQCAEPASTILSPAILLPPRYNVKLVQLALVGTRQPVGHNLRISMTV